MRRTINIIFCLVLLKVPAISQGVVFNYPVQFSQINFSKGIINPALVCLHSPVEFLSGTQQYTGYFKNISTQYAMLGIQVPFYRNERQARNTLSIRFLNDQEGVYISRNRGYLGYSFHTRIFGDYYFGGGLEIGSMGYVVQGTPSTGNASKYVIDGSSGFSIYNKYLSTGISLNQAFNNEVQPLDEVTRLYRHLNAYAGYNYIISEKVELYPSILFRFPYKTQYNYNLDVSLNTVFYKKLLLGGSYRYKNGLSFSTGLANYEIFKGYLTFCIAYNSPFGKSSLNISIFEIHVNYKYLSKKSSAARLPSLP